MKIGIVEDERQQGRLLEQYVIAWGKKNGVSCATKLYASAEIFLFAWEEEKDFTLLFLDIQMPGMDGIKLARRIREENKDVDIVFTTGIEDFMQEGYEVYALHYLLKPLSCKKVEGCLKRVWERSSRKAPVLLYIWKKVCVGYGPRKFGGWAL